MALGVKAATSLAPSRTTMQPPSSSTPASILYPPPKTPSQSIKESICYQRKSKCAVATSASSLNSPLLPDSTSSKATMADGPSNFSGLSPSNSFSSITITNHANLAIQHDRRRQSQRERWKAGFLLLRASVPSLHPPRPTDAISPEAQSGIHTLHAWAQHHNTTLRQQVTTIKHLLHTIHQATTAQIATAIPVHNAFQSAPNDVPKLC